MIQVLSIIVVDEYERCGISNVKVKQYELGKAIRRQYLNQCRLADDKAGVIRGLLLLLLLENMGSEGSGRKIHLNPNLLYA